MAAIIAALGVVLGAFGAHKLQEIITDQKLLNSWETGVRYQMFHAIGIALVGIIQSQFKAKIFNTSIILFLLGIILFSGSIYTLVLLKATSSIGLGGLGIITPIGGVLLVLAWVLTAIGLTKK